MRNAQVTKNSIITESANLFNTKGYKATSISDITKATGLTKGAIYRHFENKQDLEQHALRSLSKKMFDKIGASIREQSTCKEKFEAIFTFFEAYLNTPLYEGGCPLMNAAIEADDANPVLRQQAFSILAQLKASVTKILENGIVNNQIKKDTDTTHYSTIVIACLEGGIMMSKLERNKDAISTTTNHLRSLIDSISVT